MSYLNTIKWEIIPKTLPKVKRNCPKCNEKTHFISCEKFRVNANKSNLDVWSIYQCEKCKSTWNMTIYERINPGSLEQVEHDKYMNNDRELAREYAFDQSLYSRNKAEAVFDFVEYEVVDKEGKFDSDIREWDIEILCKYPVEMRIDKLLSEKLGVSRSRIKTMHKKGFIEIQDDKNSLKSKIKNGMKIHVVNEEVTIKQQESA